MLEKRGGGYVILGTVKILGADELKVSADCHLAATWHLLSTCPHRHRFGPAPERRRSQQRWQDRETRGGQLSPQ